jgi:hypothetical protein
MVAVPFTANGQATVVGGIATVTFQPTLYTWDVNRITVKQTTTVTNESKASIYLGQIGDQYIVDATYTGSSGDTCGGDPPTRVVQGQLLYVVWSAPTGGSIDNGATMTATIGGMQAVPDGRGFRAV